MLWGNFIFSVRIHFQSNFSLGLKIENWKLKMKIGNFQPRKKPETCVFPWFLEKPQIISKHRDKGTRLTPRSIEKFRGLSRAQPEKDRGTSRCFEVISFFQLEFIFSRISVSDWKLKTENWKWKLAIFNLERSLKPVFFLGFSKNLKSSRSISIREAQARSLISMLLYDFRFFLETVEKTPGFDRDRQVHQGRRPIRRQRPRGEAYGTMFTSPHGHLWLP